MDLKNLHFPLIAGTLSLGINILKPVPMKFSGLQLNTWGSSKSTYGIAS